MAQCSYAGRVWLWTRVLCGCKCLSSEAKLQAWVAVSTHTVFECVSSEAKHFYSLSTIADRIPQMTISHGTWRKRDSKISVLRPTRWLSQLIELSQAWDLSLDLWHLHKLGVAADAWITAFVERTEKERWQGSLASHSRQLMSSRFSEVLSQK